MRAENAAIVRSGAPGEPSLLSLPVPGLIAQAACCPKAGFGPPNRSTTGERMLPVGLSSSISAPAGPFGEVKTSAT